MKHHNVFSGICSPEECDSHDLRLLLVDGAIGSIFPEGATVSFRDFEKVKKDMRGEWEYGAGFWLFTGVMAAFSVVGIVFTLKNQILIAAEKKFRDLSAGGAKGSGKRGPGVAGQGQGAD